MSLLLNIRRAENLRGKADRFAKATFRGLSHTTHVIENCEDEGIWNESFEWPIARCIEKSEVILIAVYNYNKILSNRMVGNFQMVLQQLVEGGYLVITECLLDSNNTSTMATITLELKYQAPDGTVGDWMKENFNDQPQVRIIDHDLEVDEIDSGFKPYSYGRGSKLSLKSDSPIKSSSRSLKSVSQIIKMGRKLKSNFGSKDTLLQDTEDDLIIHKDSNHQQHLVDYNVQTEEDPENISLDIKESLLNNQKVDLQNSTELPFLKPQDFQVSITILEARQLTGLNIDPVCCIQVGDIKKYSSEKESTNCPYWNEYFVFDFHMAPSMFYDKIIKLSVIHSRNIIRSGTVIGTFKFDVSTVYHATDHQFFHKWAILTDPEDINGGPKGYLKCDIAVMGKGDSIKPPSHVEEDEDDIENNLLLPGGISAERQMAQFIVRIYKAEDLPVMNSGLLTSVKKVFTGEIKDLVDPYVQVSFAGQKGKTSVKKHQYEPAWNEQIVFTEMFPPLCRRMKIELKDKDSVMDDVIGTHYLDLQEISNEGEDGFLPTFGPSWINFYGSPREFQTLNEHKNLNQGFGEGCMYRGRLLVALKTEVADSSTMSGGIRVDIEPALPISENAAGRKEEFALFSCIMEASMIEKKMTDKPVKFEITMGIYGNNLDGKNSHSHQKSSSDSEEEDTELLVAENEEYLCSSTTNPVKPISNDKYYYYLPHGKQKPCSYIIFPWEDHRRRLYNCNLFSKLINKLENGLSEIKEMVKQGKPRTEITFKQLMEDLSKNCGNFVRLTKGTNTGGNAAKTKLDKERHRWICKELEILADQGADLVVGPKGLSSNDWEDDAGKEHISQSKNSSENFISKKAMSMKAGSQVAIHSNIKEKIKVATGMLQKLKDISNEPQHNLPDIFIWIISGDKRVAYQRIPAHNLLYSIIEEERGSQCGEMQTLFLRLPGKKASGPTGWTIQAKLYAYFWLGLNKNRKDYLYGLPVGYEQTKDIKIAIRPDSPFPLFINYVDEQIFQVRCHMYQARSLIASDSSGLSDPFAKIIVTNQSRTTQVIEETLSPTWDEMLLFDEISICGEIEDIKEDPPVIVIEFFDQDTVGKSEFIGRALVRPIVKASNEPYEKPMFPPSLQWYSVYRGNDFAGELLAAFEMLQLSSEGESSVGAPDVPPIDRHTNRGPIIPVPKNIRPVLSKYRIEVLFWGVREMKRLNLSSVDHPRVDIECAGQILSSTVIENAKKNPNFSSPVKFMEVDLPDNELYCPPITVRVVDCRKFGRFTLVGTHVIGNLDNFRYKPTVKIPDVNLRSTGNQISNFDKDQVNCEDKALHNTSTLPLMQTISEDQLSNNDDNHFQGQVNEPKSLSSNLIKGSKLSLLKEEDSTRYNSSLSIHSNSSKISHRPKSTDKLDLPLQSSQSLFSEKVAEVKQVLDEESNKDSADAVTHGAALDDTTGVNNSLPINNLDQSEKNEEKLESDNTSNTNKTQDPEIVNDKDKKKKKDDDLDESNLDWWSKYFTSKEAIAKKEEIKEVEVEEMVEDEEIEENDGTLLENNNVNDTTLLNGDATLEVMDTSVHSTDENVSEEPPKVTFKSAAKTVQFANKLSSAAKDHKSSKTKFATTKQPADPKDKITKIMIYSNELEQVSEFNGFHEWLHAFDLRRGKDTGELDDADSRIVGKFKGSMKIFPWPLPDSFLEDNIGSGNEPQFGFFNSLPNNEPVGVLVRVYIIKALDLHPADANGKADPYLKITLGKHTVSDKENYISKQLNPVFGKCFDFEATFPQESLLAVQVYDWDMVGVDDLIGETKIDLENRYYSKHRATCGLSKDYAIHGYNNWRDPMKPTQILAKLCKEYKLDPPVYKPGKVTIAGLEYLGRTDVEDENGHLKPTDEHLALKVLNNWQDISNGNWNLVSEHIETRPLFDPEKPGIEQGKLEMWVDMFPMDMPLPGPPIDVTPRKPKKYEIRCVIWNTDEVVLEDDAFFTGDKMSDIFVKGWLKGPEDLQATDVHYRSMTGEGNFNWRFIFPFEYLAAEEKIVITKKESFFAVDETEYKIPPRLNLQVWDADHFSADDFLGSLVLDLNKFPRGAKTAKKCKLEMIKTNGSVAQISLFKAKHVKGWWPFFAKDDKEEMELTGKVEAELRLLTEEEAEKSPAGLGREDPDALEKPNRPDNTFMWYLAPIRAAWTFIWSNYKWIIIKLILAIITLAILVLFFYSMPGYTVKKIFGV